MTELWVVTGVSRGLGAALARAALGPDRHVIGVSRAGNPALKDEAERRGALYEDVRLDLADLGALADAADARLGALPVELPRAVLVNNAGIVEPIGANAVLDARAVERHLAVNVGAVLLLTSRFLAATPHVPRRQVLNISSGAARRPIAGWATYCTSKAALDMHARCINAEQAGHPNAARAVSLAPGVIDTEMQATIRSADPSVFPDVERFQELKRGGQLADADEKAARILRALDAPTFGDVEIDDIRQHA